MIVKCIYYWRLLLNFIILFNLINLVKKTHITLLITEKVKILAKDLNFSKVFLITKL